MFAESSELSIDRRVAEGTPFHRDWFRFFLNWFHGCYDDETSFKFDICEGIFCFVVDWHNGQNSPEYQLHAWLDKEGFKPSSSFGSDTMGENAKMIYEFLEDHRKELF